MKPIRERLEAWGLNQSAHPSIDRALTRIHPHHHEMLWRAFHENESIAYICFSMSVPARPVTAFIDAFLAAEQALETALKEIEK